MKRLLITSALPYINGVKHLGNLAGSMLPADVYARYMRWRGREVLYVCATDEHGTPAELAAAAAGQDVATYCAEQHDIQAELGDRFGLSWDTFGRSSSPANHTHTQGYAKLLHENWFIERRTDQQYFCIDDDRFLPDRYIVGTCPKCAFPMARGDQCDQCGALMSPTDLLDPHSAISGSKNLELRETDHLYLLLSKMEPMIRKWLDERAHNWGPLARGIAYKHLDEGLRDRSITRDLKWGIPVPKLFQVPDSRMKDKVFYVWFDAPIAYISATVDSLGGESGDWWDYPDDVEYVQVMGKDNVAFHATTFPATILGAELDLKTVDVIKAFNWLNWNGGKFSTSENRGLFMDKALELYPADYWRWYLSINAPENSDTAFVWPAFQRSVNSDLADTLGNFVNRVVAMVGKYDGWVKIHDNTEVENKFWETVRIAETDYVTAMDKFEIVKGATALRHLWALGNQYLQENEPWKATKQERHEDAHRILSTAVMFIEKLADWSMPFIPFTANKLDDCTENNGDEAFIKSPGILFEKITDERLAELQILFP
jgi:methionyl-tRNA synthetase